VLSQRIPACRSRQPFCFHILAASWRSFWSTLLLFSIVYSLFLENTGGGVYPSMTTFWNQQHTDSFPAPLFANQLSPSPSTVPRLWGIEFCPSFVFTTIRIAFPATAFFSQPSGLPGGVTPNFPIFRVQDLRGSQVRPSFRFPPCSPSHFCYSAVALQCVIFAFLLRTSLWMRRDQSG
jgi:hypothetical protein